MVMKEEICSASEGLIDKVNEEGPMESYFDIINIKISKLEKRNENF